MRTQFRKITAIIFVLLGVYSTSSNAANVGLQLSLLVDVSGSVDNTEYNLQMDGYGAAFKDTDVINAILGSTGGSIAVNMVQWSSGSQQVESIGWTEINSAATSMAFGVALESAARAFSSLTAVQSALRFGTDLFAGNGFTSDRSVIDISGDGTSNSGIGGAQGRDYALANGIDTINGIVIGGDSSVADYYINNVIGGTDGFLVEAATFGDFGDAIKAKLIREISVSPVPVPAAVWLFGTGLIGLLRFTRKQNGGVAQ